MLTHLRAGRDTPDGGAANAADPLLKELSLQDASVGERASVGRRLAVARAVNIYGKDTTDDHCRRLGQLRLMAAGKTPTCSFPYEGGEWHCKTHVDRESTFCSYHSFKESQRWADDYESRIEAGATLDVVLALPMLDRPLRQMSLEQRRGLWLAIERRYPLLGEAA